MDNLVEERSNFRSGLLQLDFGKDPSSLPLSDKLSTWSLGKRKMLSGSFQCRSQEPRSRDVNEDDKLTKLTEGTTRDMSLPLRYNSLRLLVEF